MCAVIRDRGRQYRVRIGDRLIIDRTEAEVGSEIGFDVLLTADGDEVTVGAPVLTDATVTGEVLEHLRGPKVMVGTYKQRKDSRRRIGSRQDQTRIVITGIT